jgi:hypothetical protein
MPVQTMRALFRCGFLIFLLSISAGCAQLPSRQSATIKRFDVFEAKLISAASYANPFTDVSVTVTFIAPDGREHAVPAFYDGDTTWRARIAPEVAGSWTYRTAASVASDTGLNAVAGSFDCIESKRKGFIRPDPAAHYWFSFSDGTPFYGIGDTAYGLTNGLTDRQADAYLDRRRSQRFNFIRFFASGYPFQINRGLATEAGWPWGGTPEQPDYDRLNLRYFQRLEQVVKELDRRNLYAELLLFNYYSAPFVDPSVWTREREELWMRNVVARLASSPRLFLWTITNEYENYPDGKYRYDRSDDDWVRRIAASIRQLDPQNHPRSVHNVTFESNGGIGDRFAPGDEIDVLTQQEWGKATSNGRALEGTAEGIERAVWVDRVHGKPVINTENGYEWLDSRSADEGQGMTTDKSRRAAWRVFASGGGSYAAGFGGTWIGTDQFDFGDGKLRPFVLRDMGLGRQIGYLASFISTTQFLQMQPAQSRVNAPNLCLAAGDSELVVYAPQGGLVTVDLSTAPNAIYTARWLDPSTGRYKKLPPVRGGKVESFANDASHDWVLHLQSTH